MGDDGSVQVDVAAVRRAIDVLAAGGQRVMAAADAAGFRVDALPEDHVELVDLLDAFDDARRAFEHRFGEGLASAGVRLAEIVTAAEAADAGPVLVPVDAPTGAASRPDGDR